MASEKNTFDKIFNRLLGLGIQSQKDLADILGISSASVWKAKKEGRFPIKWVSILCQKYNKPPEWILGEQDIPPAQTETSLIKSLIEDILKLKNKLGSIEETTSLLREEMDALRAREDVPFARKAKKNGTNYSNQQETKEPLAVNL